MASRLIHSSRTPMCVRNSTPPHASRLQFGLSATRRARGMASNAHTQNSKSDTAWIIGSAIVFGPALIYLLGPRSTSAVTEHGNAHADPYQLKGGAAPAPVSVTKSDTVNQSDNTVEVAPEGREEAVSDIVGGDSLAGTEDNNPKTDDKPTVFKTSGPSEGSDATQNKDANILNAEGPNQGDVNDAIRQGIQSETPKTTEFMSKDSETNE